MLRKTAILLIIALLILTTAAAESIQYAGRPSTQLDAEPMFLIDLGDQDTVYLPLDDLGRVQGVSAILGFVEEKAPLRSVISSFTPTGWTQARYAFVPGLNLYNRCHLLAHLLGGTDSDENIFTGTQYLNLSGMAPYENAIVDYVRRTGNRVRVEILPYFDGENLVCSGVFINAKSIEDEGLAICAFCYNVQPGVAIDYKTGASALAETTADLDYDITTDESEDPEQPAAQHFVLNTNTHRFHVPTCHSVDDMKEKNKQDFYGDREELIEMGYKPCGNCKP